MNTRRRAQGGFSLLEVMVVIAILLAIVAVSVPALNAVLQLEQRRCARDLALTYERLNDEAVLRNVTFRVAFHIDAGYYEVEVGDADTLIYDDPDARAAEEERVRDLLAGFDEEERAEYSAGQSRFETITTFHKRRIDLPNGTLFGGVYTPQYGEMVKPTYTEDTEDQVVVYSYIFPNGFSEPTIVQIVEAKHPEEGFTVVVEPLTGRVQLLPTLVDEYELLHDIPTTAPRVP